VQYAELMNVFRENQDEEKAAQMAAYMKNKFAFLGLSASFFRNQNTPRGWGVFWL